MGIKSRKAPGLLFLDSSISPTTTMTWLSRVQGGAAVLGLARSPRCTEPLAPIPARPSGGLLQLLWFPAVSLALLSPRSHSITRYYNTMFLTSVGT